MLVGVRGQNVALEEMPGSTSVVYPRVCCTSVSFAGQHAHGSLYELYMMHTLATRLMLCRCAQGVQKCGGVRRVTTPLVTLSSRAPVPPVLVMHHGACLLRGYFTVQCSLLVAHHLEFPTGVCRVDFVQYFEQSARHKASWLKLGLRTIICEDHQLAAAWPRM